MAGKQPRSKQMKYASHNWTSVDWSKPNVIIASEMGVTPSAVAYQRGKGERRNVRAHLDWSDVDWNKGDACIAKQKRCTRNAVRYQRLKRSAGPELTVFKRVMTWLKGIVA